jgi:acyl dehydratase
MISVDYASELAAHVGQELGVSSWRSLTFEDFVAFGAISGDASWIHTDRERARRDTPFGDVIAQGFLTLSLVTALSGECFEIRHKERSLNYGLEHVRFTHPVTPADRVRLRLSLGGFVAVNPGVSRLTLSCVLEIEGKAKPALVADWLSMVYDAAQKSGGGA